MRTMRALVLDGPGQASIQEVPAPIADVGQVVVDVHRVGLCGTDGEFYNGEMAYLATGQARYPLRPGHEWCGTVSAVGNGVASGWLGTRVTGDTMLGCGHCDRCLRGRQHLCENRFEVGILGGWHGAVAEQVVVPVASLHALPPSVDDTAGAMVEPGGNSHRAALAAGAIAGRRVAVFGPGTIGLLSAAFARSMGAEVHVIGESMSRIGLARSLGFTAWLAKELPELVFAAVIDCTDSAQIPARAVDLVEPGGRVVCVGLAGRASMVDTRKLVLKDVTLIGRLSGSPSIASTITAFADGVVDPAPLVAATVGLDRAPDILAGWRPDHAGAGPKLHIDPRR